MSQVMVDADVREIIKNCFIYSKNATSNYLLPGILISVISQNKTILEERFNFQPHPLSTGGSLSAFVSTSLQYTRTTFLAGFPPGYVDHSDMVASEGFHEAMEEFHRTTGNKGHGTFHVAGDVKQLQKSVGKLQTFLAVSLELVSQSCTIFTMHPRIANKKKGLSALGVLAAEETGQRFSAERFAAVDYDMSVAALSHVINNRLFT